VRLTSQSVVSCANFRRRIRRAAKGVVAMPRWPLLRVYPYLFAALLTKKRSQQRKRRRGAIEGTPLASLPPLFSPLTPVPKLILRFGCGRVMRGRAGQFTNPNRGGINGIETRVSVHRSGTGLFFGRTTVVCAAARGPNNVPVPLMFDVKRGRSVNDYRSRISLVERPS
jgi:hypothetical protein